VRYDGGVAPPDPTSADPDTESEEDAPLATWPHFGRTTVLYRDRLEYRVLWTRTVVPLDTIDAVEPDVLAGVLTVHTPGRTHRFPVGLTRARRAAEAVVAARRRARRRAGA
jgi:hypothetical protein